MKGQRIGYIRVSSFDQNPERQLNQNQVDKVFVDKALGKDTQRPELESLRSFVRDGDIVGFIVWTDLLVTWMICAIWYKSLPIRVCVSNLLKNV